MWQRIQTVYLLVTFVLTLLMFFLPLSHFMDGGMEYVYTGVGLKHVVLSPDASVSSTTFDFYSIPLALLLVLILVVNVIGIGLYKNRVFQIRFNIFNCILNLGVYALFALFVWTTRAGFETEGMELTGLSYGIALTFPLVNIVLTYLAIRAIGKDEALVRSYDRLR